MSEYPGTTPAQIANTSYYNLLILYRRVPVAGNLEAGASYFNSLVAWGKQRGLSLAQIEEIRAEQIRKRQETQKRVLLGIGRKSADTFNPARLPKAPIVKNQPHEKKEG